MCAKVLTVDCWAQLVVSAEGRKGGRERGNQCPFVVSGSAMCDSLHFEAGLRELCPRSSSDSSFSLFLSRVSVQ